MRQSGLQDEEITKARKGLYRMMEGFIHQEYIHIIRNRQMPDNRVSRQMKQNLTELKIGIGSHIQN